MTTTETVLVVVVAWTLLSVLVGLFLGAFMRAGRGRPRRQRW